VNVREFQLSKEITHLITAGKLLLLAMVVWIVAIFAFGYGQTMTELTARWSRILFRPLGC
jgi:hypothetical protein